MKRDYPCIFYIQEGEINEERFGDYPHANEELERLQRKGVPVFFTLEDSFKHLIQELQVDIIKLKDRLKKLEGEE